ncbi:hypothetical protein [Kaistia defluvii]|uniref:Uncharacterized protein n=1 Tax=Kaistia defluvii TaxID=410841 RepID=A0ABV2QT80_9HYPH
MRWRYFFVYIHSMNENQSALLVTSIPPSACKAGVAKLTTTTAIASFERSGFRVLSLGRPGEKAGLGHFPTVGFREASSPGMFSLRYGPAFGDLLSAIGGEDIGAVVNADIYMVQSNILDVLDTASNTILVARRVDVEHLGGEVIGVYRRGIDGIFFSRNTVSEIREDADLACFQLGAPYWDVVLPVAASFHHRLRFIPAPFLCHPIHEAKWNEADYRLLRTQAVKAIISHAEKYRHRSQNADAFLTGLERRLRVTKPRSALRREKQIAEYMGHWLSQFETPAVPELEVDLSDPVIRSSAQHLFAHSVEGLSLARLLDSPELSWPAAVRVAFRAFRRSFRSHRRAQRIERQIRLESSANSSRS